jgi:predicted ribosome quality control (RQC) complex YloA/Tae2 family protein
MKGRLSWLDVRATVNECRCLVGAHIKNIYSTSKKALYIKFHNKKSLYIDPPGRFHLTKTAHKAWVLMPMAVSLRKTVSNARVEGVSQAGFDRVACIHLSTSRGKMKLVVEMYAGGNVILLDESQIIVNLLRPVVDMGTIKGAPYVINAPDLELTLERYRSIEEENLKRKVSTFLSLAGYIADDIVEEMKREGVEEEKGFEEFFERVKGRLESVGGYGVVLYDGKTAVSFEAWKPASLPKGGKEFGTFGDAVDAAFEAPKETESKAEKKKRRMKESQERSLREKMEEARGLREKAEKLQGQIKVAEEAVEVARQAMESGISEEEFRRFREESVREGNEAAFVLVGADFGKKHVDLLVDGVVVRVDMGKRIYEEVNGLYGRARRMEEKALRAREALDSTNKALGRKKIVYEKVERREFWFEKFNWFITRTRELVVGGKDAKQNEQVVKKYLGETDTYFHAEMAGASSVVLKGRGSEEGRAAAAAMAMCLSKAWESNVVVPVFSVKGSQVNRAAPSGEHLKTGSFMIEGKKEFHYPHRMEYGFTLMYLTPKEVRSLDVTEKEGKGDLENIRERVGEIEMGGAEENNEVEDEGSEFEGETTDGEEKCVLAMCGPYEYIDGPKYRILPGTSKQGLMIKELLALALEEAAPENKRYVASIAEREMQRVLIPKSRLAHAEIKKRGSHSVFARKTKKK